MQSASATCVVCARSSPPATTSRPAAGRRPAPATVCRRKPSGPAPRDRWRRERLCAPSLILARPARSRSPLFDRGLAAGTSRVRSLKPNEMGVYDIRGNVWEWCNDFFDAVISPSSVRDPSGPLHGLARVIRGGSFVSSVSGWSREYRSSEPPEQRSRFTGFRVARSLDAVAAAGSSGLEFFRPYNERPAGFEIAQGGLTPLAHNLSRAQWDIRARELRSKWEGILHPPKFPEEPPPARLVRNLEQRNFDGELFEVQFEPGSTEKVYV